VNLTVGLTAGFTVHSTDRNSPGIITGHILF